MWTYAFSRTYTWYQILFYLCSERLQNNIPLSNGSTIHLVNTFYRTLPVILSVHVLSQKNYFLLDIQKVTINRTFTFLAFDYFVSTITAKTLLLNQCLSVISTRLGNCILHPISNVNIKIRSISNMICVEKFSTGRDVLMRIYKYTYNSANKDIFTVAMHKKYSVECSISFLWNNTP